MANIKDIKTRIGSVKNTRQITKAMKMVAAAKLRRAQEAVLAARPYAYRIYAILLSLAKGERREHPLLQVKPEKKVLLVVLAGDKGLCGSFNSSITKAADAFIKQKEAEGLEVLVDCIGKKVQDYYKKRRTIRYYHEGILNRPDFKVVGKIADEILAEYKADNLDAVYLLYNEFKSAIQQTVSVERLIPVSLEAPEGVVSELTKKEEAAQPNYLFEPSEDEILEEVIPRHFRTQLFRAILESAASEHGARMSAMENATKNASEMIEKLTLSYNKARQAAITTELSEIVGGMEAMN